MPSWDINRDMPDLTGKVAIVTGGNTGLGLEIVRHLALHNAKVYMASRTESRALAAISKLHSDHPELKQKAGIVWLKLDLCDLQSCRNAAREVLEKEGESGRLDILINNAGVMATPYELTKDGVENQFQANFLGHFAFTVPLLPLLIKTSKDPESSVRLVQVSSMGHNFASRASGGIKFDTLDSVNRKYSNAYVRYGQSKLANVLFAKALAKRLKDERIFSSALHPGNIRTELNRGTLESYPWARPIIAMIEWGLIAPYKGAITPLYAATSPEIESSNLRGEYFVPYAKKTAPSKLAQDDKLADDLWTLAEKLVAEKTTA
ncbi:NAD(P)-binding protein [Sistotremastrum niveocremeum HHB9708]|uniref:NAD(P)-binding protein n=1 Tax=Sistotremastrum niveocremeum HHB9708 TaxID=1314777 RepID=A0A164PKA5_9AGAM|nr:NAD(P)-binding protein [Sistotremastrum niveocremeum HHB9708]